MRALLGIWAAIVVLNYAFAPGHSVTAPDLTGSFMPARWEFSSAVFASVWLSRGKAAIVWLVLNAALLGAGQAAAKWLDSRAASIVRTWLLGLAPAALTLLGLGLCGLLCRPAIALVLAGMAAFLLASRPRIEQHPGGWRAAALAASPCLLALPAALAPEIVFDALRYHLGLPWLFLHEHRIFHVERFLFASYPATMEMLYGAALAFGTTVTAKLLAWQCFVMSVIQLHRVLAPRLNRGHAVLLCAAFAAMPFLSTHAAFAGTDHPLICLELAVFATILERLESGSPEGKKREWLIAGWLMGTALGVKYLGAFGLFAIGISLAAVWNLRMLASFARVTIPAAALVPLAWLLKNWLFTGNPVYPYFFGHAELEQETFRLHLLWADEWKLTHSWLAGWAKLIPVSLTQGIYDSRGEALAPYLFMIFGLAAARAKPFPRPERWLLALTAVLYVTWSHSGGGIYRYLAPVYPAATLLAGYLLSRAATSTPRKAVTAVLALSLAAQIPVLLAAHRRQSDTGAVFAGAEAERAYLDRILPPRGRYLTAMARACGIAGEGQLYMLGDPKTFYAPGRCLTEFEFARPLLMSLAANSPSPGRMRVRLKQRGITAILYLAEGMVSVGVMSGATLTGKSLNRYQEFWRDYTEPAWIDEHPKENNYYWCCILRPKSGPFVPPASQIWYLVPGMEYLTLPIDRNLDAGRFDEARRGALELTGREPGYAPGWYRLLLAGRKLGDRAAQARATSALKRLGFSVLLKAGA